MGKGLSFPRGVHPPEAKELAEEMAIEVLPTPATLQVPVLQHIGAPSKPVVKSRAVVEMGQVLAEAGGFVSVPSHASLPGQVSRSCAVTLPNGRHVECLPLKVDVDAAPEGAAVYEDVLGGEWPTDGLERYDPEAIAEAALSAGLVGQGGAAFPTHVKLRRNEERPIDTLLINGCECEPYLTADYRLMLEAAAAVVAGAELGGVATGAGRVIICVEDNKPKAVDALREAVGETKVEIYVMRTKYPQGGEKQLIHAALGRDVPVGGLPLDVGVVVLNVGTCAALARAVFRGKPLTHRVVTVTGGGIAKPKNVLAPIGASYSALIEFCGGLKEDAARVVAGGPMMGFTLADLEVPVTKGTSGITVLTRGEVQRAKETHCVRCGRCVDVCPMGLVPTKIALAARVEALEVCERYHIAACMECGCCAYMCPASLPLVQLIRMGKVEKAKRDAAAKSA